MFGIVLVGAVALVGLVVAARARAAADAASTGSTVSQVPTGTGAVPADSGQPTPSGTASPDIATMATTLNASLHMVGGDQSAAALAEFQAAAGVPVTGAYDTATSQALAKYITSPPMPDVE